MGFGSGTNINNYINEFVELGVNTGFFNTEQKCENVYKLLSGVNVLYDNSLPGDAYVSYDDGNIVMHINPDRAFGCGEKFTSEVLFHEFSHIVNDIHRDLFFKPNGLLKMYKDTFVGTMRKNFKPDYNSSVIESDDPKNPFVYILYGAVLLDEAIAQNMAEEMLSYKYGAPRKKVFRYCDFADVNYYTDFNEYGIYQELAERFSGTIRGIGNLKELCVASLDDEFTNNLIVDHAETGFTYEALYKKLSYLGVIYFAQERKNGHYNNIEAPDAVDVNMAKRAYYDAINFCIAGTDNRPRPAYTKIKSGNGSLTF